jgi:hypothetical protein
MPLPVVVGGFEGDGLVGVPVRGALAANPILPS